MVTNMPVTNMPLQIDNTEQATVQQGTAPRVDRVELEQEFVELLRARWAHGAVEYGDQSFEKPLATTADEVLQELVDVVAWGFVAWAQTRARLQVVTDSATAIETLARRVAEAERERDALRARLAQVRDALAGAGDCPTWASLAGLVGRVAELVGREDAP